MSKLYHKKLIFMVEDVQPDVAPANPEPLPDHDPIPFGIPDIAPLIPDPVPAPVDPPVIEQLIPPPAPAPANVAPFHLVEFDVNRVDLPIVFLQDIPAPVQGKLQFEIMSRRILELEMTPRPLPCPCQPAFVPPRSSPSPFSHPPAPLTPFQEFDARFLTVKQQISYLLRHVYELEGELAHVRNLLFFPPPPPPPPPSA
ncbi:predicted GPI-anchored protein 58 [Helianthus annuus]|uniref:predicted GPI-anchored protein 58 n=1 Tax=Helianthus annuus TaxID=4232 RepID=UPI000B9053B9|nr:predicted GPI-anchored protein 58 [Helianthus annuus]